MEENSDAKQIITQLMKNHQTAVSMIAHEIRNPLTLVSSSLQVIEAQHPEVKEFYSWNQTLEDVKFMCSLLDELSTFNNGNSLHYSVFRIEQLLKNVAVSLPFHWTRMKVRFSLHQKSPQTWEISPAIK